MRINTEFGPLEITPSDAIPEGHLIMGSHSVDGTITFCYYSAITGKSATYARADIDEIERHLMEGTLGQLLTIHKRDDV